MWQPAETRGLQQWNSVWGWHGSWLTPEEKHSGLALGRRNPAWAAAGNARRTEQTYLEEGRAVKSFPSNPNPVRCKQNPHYFILVTSFLIAHKTKGNRSHTSVH